MEFLTYLCPSMFKEIESNAFRGFLLSFLLFHDELNVGTQNPAPQCLKMWVEDKINDSYYAPYRAAQSINVKRNVFYVFWVHVIELER